MHFLLSLAGGTLKDWIASKNKIAETQAETRASAVRNGIPGWSDEYLVIVWSYPAIGSFIPFLQPDVAAGMTAFNALPEWYQYGFMSVTGAVFGLDKMIKFKGGKLWN